MRDVSTIDCEGFFRELQVIRRDVEAALGEEDIAHLRRALRIGRAATALGLATAWIPNPISMVALAFGRVTRGGLMHHIEHRGYDRVPGIPAKYTSRVFATGWRRFVDFPDWVAPEAWAYEHNSVHHQQIGTVNDPDSIEVAAEPLRTAATPVAVKLAQIGLATVLWRVTAYPSIMFGVWLGRGRERAQGDKALPPGFARTLLLRGFLPYGVYAFGLVPALYLLLGPLAATSALVNSLGAEVVQSIHTFIIAFSNHAGDDLYRFDTPPRSKSEAAVRQVIGSTNYSTGSEFGYAFTRGWM